MQHNGEIDLRSASPNMGHVRTRLEFLAKPNTSLPPEYRHEIRAIREDAPPRSLLINPTNDDGLEMALHLAYQTADLTAAPIFLTQQLRDRIHTVAIRPQNYLRDAFQNYFRIASRLERHRDLLRISSAVADPRPILTPPVLAKLGHLQFEPH
jgi:hypothetical protein